MVRRVLIALSLITCVALSGCASTDSLVGTWRQTGIVGPDGTELAVPADEAAVLELRHAEQATLSQPGFGAEDVEFTWDVERGLLVLTDHPGWDVRSAYELAYELDGDRLTTDWMDGPPRRVFERQ